MSKSLVDGWDKKLNIPNPLDKSEIKYIVDGKVVAVRTGRESVKIFDELIWSHTFGQTRVTMLSIPGLND